MESFKVENVSFTYPDKDVKALSNINLTVNQGEFVLLCGRSGCGKTTLLRLLKSSLTPNGKIDGDIYFMEKPLSHCDTREQASQIGFVMQNPENQVVTDKVWHELAFGLESLGLKTNEIRARVSEMASFFGIQNWFYKNVDELSGGQKQLLNLASVMVMQPSVLILDEPASQLDPIASQEFLKTLEKINRELGTTIILTEHRLEDAFSLADRVIVMEDGCVVADDTPKNIGKILKSLKHPMYMALPTPVRVFNSVSDSCECPLTVRDARVWLEEFAKENSINPDVIPKDRPQAEEDTIIEMRDVWFRYDKNLSDVVKGFNLTVNKGEFFCLVGGNGTGKTTALSIISGIFKPYRGKVFVKGQEISKINNLYDGLLGVLPQNPQTLFVKNTVYLDLMDILDGENLSKDEKDKRVQSVARLLRIENVLDSHPYDLSGGEQQRSALAKVLLKEPEILLLDEPTKGMDAQFKQEFAHILLGLKANGVTILMVSHDIEFCAEYAQRCALVFDGSITSMGTPREFFKGKSFYTTSANRMARTTLTDAILSDDIILACGGDVNKNINTPKSLYKKADKKAENNKPSKEKTKPSKATILSVFFILFLIPLTIYAGVLFGDRKYYFTSLLILLEAMVPFFMLFEARKPKARELVVISVLCALGVAGRMAFFMLPQFKPVVALVIIAGVCLGGETGFLVGAVTGFVSNFFFGHGPWTPWQMFAFGVIGFLGGILFKKGVLPKTKISLCIFGFLSTLVVYGSIVNPSSVVMWQNKITLKMLVASWAVGLPFDLVHAASTVIFLWILSKPMIQKLERIKIKYGLIE